jgi:hypothetical protein
MMKGKFAMNIVSCAFAVVTLAISMGGVALAAEGEQTVPCKKLPIAVMKAFSKSYPKATIKNCSREIEDGKISYEVASKEKAIGRDVLYDAKGNVIVVEETMAISEAPESVQQAFNKKFSKAEIILVERLLRGTSVNFEFQIKLKGRIREVVFDSAGNELEP